jgi:hypothetical protein
VLKQLPALEQKSDGRADDPLERVNFIFAVNQFFRVNVSIIVLLEILSAKPTPLMARQILPFTMLLRNNKLKGMINRIIPAIICIRYLEFQPQIISLERGKDNVTLLISINEYCVLTLVLVTTENRTAN